MDDDGREQDAEHALLTAQMQLLDCLAEVTEDVHMVEAAILAHRRTVDAREKHHTSDDDDVRLWAFVEEGVFLRPLDIDSDLVEIAVGISEAREWRRRLVRAVCAHGDARKLRGSTEPCDNRLYDRVFEFSCNEDYEGVEG